MSYGVCLSKKNVAHDGTLLSWKWPNTCLLLGIFHSECITCFTSLILIILLYLLSSHSSISNSLPQPTVREAREWMTGDYLPIKLNHKSDVGDLERRTGR